MIASYTHLDRASVNETSEEEEVVSSPACGDEELNDSLKDAPLPAASKQTE